MTHTIQHDAFLQDVLTGLSQQQKTLPCKWFYDATGSALFEKITETPEYYLTRTEAALLDIVAKDLNERLPDLSSILEPGSGASVKTRRLLNQLPQLSQYVPIDISGDFLIAIAKQLQLDYPHLSILPIEADFTQLDLKIPAEVSNPRMLFFPGSTIGNFSQTEAIALLRDFQNLASKNSYLLIGVDGTQDVQQLSTAYDDAAGFTAQFNQNLLVRANRELQANFKLDQFSHSIRWVPTLHRIEMHLMSLSNQNVKVNEQLFHFSKGETIFTESCHKYPRSIFLQMASQADWQLAHEWHDTEGTGFRLYLLQSTQA